MLLQRRRDEPLVERRHPRLFTAVSSRLLFTAARVKRRGVAEAEGELGGRTWKRRAVACTLGLSARKASESGGSVFGMLAGSCPENEAWMYAA